MSGKLISAINEEIGRRQMYITKGRASQNMTLNQSLLDPSVLKETCIITTMVNINQKFIVTINIVLFIHWKGN